MTIMYHFVGETLRDGRPIPADGEWLEHEGRLKMCESGLHASPTPWEALQYAPGAVLCEVEIDGEVIKDTDKVVARRRKILRRADLTEVCRKFARDQALSVIHLWNAPPVVVEYLKTGKEELRDAAWDAAWAARAAARDAAEAAARDAAEAAAWAAAEAAARDAAGNAAGKSFNRLALEALP